MELSQISPASLEADLNLRKSSESGDGENEPACDREDKENEEDECLPSHTLRHPRTMVVEPFNTDLASRTMS